MHGCKDDFDVPLSYIHETPDVMCLLLKRKIVLNVLRRKSHLTCARRIILKRIPRCYWREEIPVSSHGFRKFLDRDMYSRVPFGSTLTLDVNFIVFKFNK